MITDHHGNQLRGQRRILLYSHDSFGLGHLRRSITLAGAIAEADPEVSILCLTGSPVANLFKLPPRCDLVKIPCITKDDSGSYVPRFLPSSLDRVIELRSELISATVRSFRPDVLLVDHTPAGPGDELIPTLRRVRMDSPHTRVILGLRDILDAPVRAKAQMHASGILDLLRNEYEDIIVYGHPKVLDICEAYDMPEEIRARSQYVGFVCPPAPEGSPVAPKPSSKVKILVTAGGGEDGYNLLSGVAAALLGPHHDLDVETTLIAGPLMSSDEVEALKVTVRCDQRLNVVETTADMRHFLAQADLVVSMGGYNSTYEALAQSCRLLVLPRSQPRLEQVERCRRLQGLGLLTTLKPSSLGDPKEMAEAIQTALARKRPDPSRLGLAFDGAQVAARRILGHCNPKWASVESRSVAGI